jgi:hypothetical protein
MIINNISLARIPVVYDSEIEQTIPSIITLAKSRLFYMSYSDNIKIVRAKHPEKFINLAVIEL